MLLEESSHNGNLDQKWSLTQKGTINPSIVVDSCRKEIYFDLSKNKHHVCNQHRANDDLCKHMRQKRCVKNSYKDNQHAILS